MATSATVSATNNAEIDGLLSGYKWIGAISYSFPDAPADYSNPYSGGSGEPTLTGFASAPAEMQSAINYAIGLIRGYTSASISYNGTNGADIMIAQSPSANPTSYAYYPGNYAAGGDVWFGTQYDYSLAKLGNYYFTTALHELGHALGLKHSQETGGPANVAVPSAHDDSEYTVMSYRSYVGASTSTGYTNEAYGYPQTYMANDILALQTLYGANYTTQGTNTVYTWSPTTGQEFINGVGQLAPGGGTGGSANRIYEAIWDGGGTDTYDLSNYTTNLSINLNPGASSLFSSVQLANLGNGHYASGNVYNAYLYNNDARSYIDNAIGGSGNDTIVGNAIANVLNGGAGNDTITGGGGNDTIVGGPGTDTSVYSGNRANYVISYDTSTQTFTVADQRSGSSDGTDVVTGVENFQFADVTVASTTLISQLVPIVLEGAGATALVQLGNNYFMNPTAGGSGPELVFRGSPVTAGQFSGWAPIGAEQTSGGYVVAWKVTGADQYNVWNVDGGGNFVSNTLGSLTSASSALQSIETTFHQDLNGDGTIGVPVVAASGTTIEASGSTVLLQSGNNYFMQPAAGGAAIELLFHGSPVVSGQFSGWTTIGAEQTSGGYVVAWKATGADQYNIWNVDIGGNFASNTLGNLTSTSSALQSMETTFHQDLNGDGTIGAPGSVVSGTTIEAYGSSTLIQSGNNYFMKPTAGGTGVELLFHGSPVAAGQFSGWTPIGAEQTSGGYVVAWKATGADQYNIWNVDTGGNFASNTLGNLTGTSSALLSMETTFHQDLNGDGTIGVSGSVVSGTTIEAFGSTALVQSGSNYFLTPAAGGSGPELLFHGSPVAAGQFSGWAPIGAEQTSGGYVVAWKVTGADQYNIWNVDSSGNFASNTLGSLTSQSSALQSMETTFHQDLNGDATIGLRAAALNASTFDFSGPAANESTHGFDNLASSEVRDYLLHFLEAQHGFLLSA